MVSNYHKKRLNTISFKYILKDIEDDLTKEFIKLIINDEGRVIELEKKFKDNKLLMFIDECRSLFIGDIHFGTKPYIRPFKSYVNIDIGQLKNVFSVVRDLQSRTILL